jgi:DNA polymerase-1
MDLPDTGYLTDGGIPSVGKDALLAWAVKYPRTRSLRRYRRILHNWSQFIRPVPKLLDNVDGRIHASYNQSVARTGRTSSSGPNEQNRPRDDTCKELGVPPIQSTLYCSRFPGGSLPKGDYSQLELKLLASMSRDPAMVECYAKGWDLHARTTLGYADQGVGAFAPLLADGASAAGVQILPGVTLDFPQKVELASKGPKWKWCRTQGKRVNFLTSYQGGPGALQAVLAEAGVYLSQDECAELIEAWHRIYPGVQTYMDDVVARAIYADGNAVAPDGRVRHLPALVHGNEEEQGHAGREAGNFGIQWMAAKLTMVALLLLDESLRALGAQTLIVGTVHDSIILDSPADEAEAATELLRLTMEEAARDPRWAPPGLLHPSIPITADVD